MSRSRYDQAQYMNAAQEMREHNRQLRAFEAAELARQAAVSAAVARRRQEEREARMAARYAESERVFRPLRAAVFGHSGPVSARELLRELRRQDQNRDRLWGGTR